MQHMRRGRTQFRTQGSADKRMNEAELGMEMEMELEGGQPDSLSLAC